MTHIARLLALFSLLAAPAFAADGVWRLRERFCLSVDGQRQCSRGTEDLMFLGGTTYYRPDASDGWTEIGTVSTTGKTFVVHVTRAGVGRLVASRAGVDVSEMLTEFTFTYRGRIAGSRIAAGRARVNIALDAYGEVHRIRGNAVFTGKRIGDAYPVPPPDEYYYGYDYDYDYDYATAASRTSEPAAFSTVRAAVAGAVGWNVGE